jgi:hypothetical protein
MKIIPDPESGNIHSDPESGLKMDGFAALISLKSFATVDSTANWSLGSNTSYKTVIIQYYADYSAVWNVK